MLRSSFRMLECSQTEQESSLSTLFVDINAGPKQLHQICHDDHYVTHTVTPQIGFKLVHGFSYEFRNIQCLQYSATQNSCSPIYHQISSWPLKGTRSTFRYFSVAFDHTGTFRDATSKNGIVTTFLVMWCLSHCDNS